MKRLIRSVENGEHVFYFSGVPFLGKVFINVEVSEFLLKGVILKEFHFEVVDELPFLCFKPYIFIPSDWDCVEGSILF